MDIKKLQKIVINALENVKAIDIAVFVAKQNNLFDRVIIASGNSNRQTKALAAAICDDVKQAGGDIISIEGEATGEWVLVDLGDIIVHIMQPAIRNYYRLEEIYEDNRIDLDIARRGLIRKVTRTKKEEPTVTTKSKTKSSTKKSS